MKVLIKPHSTLRKFFSDNAIEADLNYYIDVMHYLKAMQPNIINYIKLQESLGIDEGVTFLDKNLKELSLEELAIKKVKKDDILHIVPAIGGGGGKRGGLLAILAVAMFAFIAIPMLSLGAAGAAAGAGAAGAGAAGAGVAGAGAAAGATGHFGSNLLIQLGLAAISSLFNSRTPKDEPTRNNDMFGSLVNSTASGTPIGLNYGMVRKGGQLISGYIKTIEGASDTVTVRDVLV